MIEFIRAGGWLMIPIILSSVIAMAIIIERLLSLRVGKVIPASDIQRARELAASGNVTDAHLAELHDGSVVGSVLSTGLSNRAAPRHVLKENLEEAGRHAVHKLERYLNALGTIASITPLMGLLGTVLGMITAFSKITQVGVGDPASVAGGISQALFTTAAGIFVAIVAMIFHRYFKGKVDNYVIGMEQEAVKLIEIVNQNKTGAPRPSPRTPSPASAASKAEAAIAAARQKQRPLATGGRS
uniref:MotA/TolQ/ExbB proton channel family protein n=1 Tax=uncultured Thiotrichaceae bacterium TaxID=298394 RepID=A0A6S6TCN2_9GAMM|nr:MAG: MotA/TolQ/ExbB proton channel family protein [uncultured Thiotrichaceae bacterium]